MGQLRRTLPVFILLCIIMISSCGEKESNAGASVSGNGSPQQQDILTESQQTRQELAGNVAAANALLSTISADGVPLDSTEIIRSSNGDAPSSYKPHGQMVSEKYKSYGKKTGYTVDTTPDSKTTKEPEAVITSNPQPQQTSSSSSTAPPASDQTNQNSSASLSSSTSSSSSSAGSSSNNN